MIFFSSLSVFFAVKEFGQNDHLVPAGLTVSSVWEYRDRMRKMRSDQMQLLALQAWGFTKGMIVVRLSDHVI